MADKSERFYMIIISIFFLVIVILGIKDILSNRKIEQRQLYIEKLEKELDYYRTLDSVYTVKRDSIVYDIKYRDSIITKIRTKYESEKDGVLVSSDNAIVDKFNKLVWAD